MIYATESSRIGIKASRFLSSTFHYSNAESGEDDKKKLFSTFNLIYSSESYIALLQGLAFGESKRRGTHTKWERERLKREKS